MSEEIDSRLHYAFREFIDAVDVFDRKTRVPLRGYTVKQPYAKGIRRMMGLIERKLQEEFREIQVTLEPDPKE